MALPTNTGAFIHKGVNCTPNTIQTAQGVPYDNTSSGLSATNVQSALDEVGDRLLTGFYGICTDPASTQAKTATISNAYGFSLTVGTSIKIKFSYRNSEYYPTLNVNNTGDIAIYSGANAMTPGQSWDGGSIVEFVYDGTYWIVVDYHHAYTVLQQNTSNNFGYPLLYANGTGSDVTAATYKNDAIKANPSTGTIIAPYFSGDISDCTGLSGASVSYNNTNSGLVATDVQGAVDEVNAKTLSDGLHNITLESGFTVDEYMNYFKIGKLVVVNIGGVKHNTATATALVCQGLPVMRSRALGVIANDNTTNKVTLLYGQIGSGVFRISAHEANVRYYGQITYLTD